MQATENSGYDASDDYQVAEASCAEFLCHPVGAADNLEQPEKLKRHPPSIVKQSDEDREFWSRRFTGMSADNEPSTPNNTPLGCMHFFLLSSSASESLSLVNSFTLFMSDCIIIVW